MLRIITNAVTIEVDDHPGAPAVEFIRNVLPLLSVGQPVVIEAPAGVIGQIRIRTPTPSGAMLIPADAGIEFINFQSDDTK